MLDKTSSDRLASLRFPLIVGVVFIHAYGTDVTLAGRSIGLVDPDTFTDFVRNLISQGLARTAVPLFFLMAGYFLFLGFDGSLNGYLHKLSSRVRSLLIPFVVWNIATLLAMAVAQSTPSTQAYFSGQNAPITSYDLVQLLKAIFGIGRMPISYQFWFIRDLMLLVLAMPLLHFMATRWPAVLLTLLCACWMAGAWAFFAPSSEASLFFTLGAVSAMQRLNLFRMDRYTPAIVAIYLVVLVLDTLLFEYEGGKYLHRVSIALGVLAALGVSKSMIQSTRLRRALLALAGSSFFVFAAHEPLLTIAKKIAYRLIEPATNAAVLALYFLVPVCLIASLVGIHRLATYALPNITRIATGGR